MARNGRSIVQLNATFAFQSYFDDVLQQSAILAQAVGQSIVESTKQTAQGGGSTVALHPMSQSPVAIRFKGGSANSAEMVITPGQKVNVGSFDGFDWGLPFGWLGGGPVALYVLGEESDIAFPSTSSPIIFHRTRIQIANGNPPPVPTGFANWPKAFAWSFAERGVPPTATPQRAAPIFQLIPDITFMQYRETGVVAPVELIAQWINTDPFELRSPPDQAVGYSDGIHYYPIIFQSANVTAGGPNLAAPLWLPPEFGHLAGDATAFYLIDPGNVLTDGFVDVVRYGRFM